MVLQVAVKVKKKYSFRQQTAFFSTVLFSVEKNSKSQLPSAAVRTVILLTKTNKK